MSEIPHRIEVFQELTISSGETTRENICGLLNRKGPSTAWYRAKDIENRIEANGTPAGRGVIAFEREAKGTPAVQLVLVPTDENGSGLGEKGRRYRLANIVPVVPGKLGVHGYNDALEEFYRDVIEPVSDVPGVAIEISSRMQTMTDWTSEEAAVALHRFSAAANMSTGANHPCDAARWRAFVIADHRAAGKLGAGRLKRWLIEVDRWPEDFASELVSDWEKGLELLEDYDKAS